MTPADLIARNARTVIATHCRAVPPMLQLEYAIAHFKTS
jgi:hypothetical protein